MSSFSSLQNQLDPSWHRITGGFFNSEEYKKLSCYLEERQRKAQVFPDASALFRAFDGLSVSSVKVVILGQDPYHGEGQAIGRAFAVPPSVRTPPSLRNIFKEIELELGKKPSSSTLESWHQQGVLLLNSVLTVEAGTPGAHAKQGWEILTDQMIHGLAEDSTPKVFLLWGAYAEKKADQISSPRHLVLKAPHPSPLSAHRGFFGCNHFKAANEFLIANARDPIDWCL